MPRRVSSFAVLDRPGSDLFWQTLRELKEELAPPDWLVKAHFTEHHGDMLYEERYLWIGVIRYETLLAKIGRPAMDLFKDKFLFFGDTERFPRQEVLGDLFDPGDSVWDWAKKKV